MSDNMQIIARTVLKYGPRGKRYLGIARMRWFLQFMQEVALYVRLGTLFFRSPYIIITANHKKRHMTVNMNAM